MRSLENENRILFSPPLATGSGHYGSNNISRTAPAVEGINLNEAQPVGRTEIPSQPLNESDLPELGKIEQLFPHLRDQGSWELPFL